MGMMALLGQLPEFIKRFEAMENKVNVIYNIEVKRAEKEGLLK
jgi:hypothetical protein